METDRKRKHRDKGREREREHEKEWVDRQEGRQRTNKGFKGTRSTYNTNGISASLFIGMPEPA
jgi:hypothetical protein